MQSIQTLSREIYLSIKLLLEVCWATLTVIAIVHAWTAGWYPSFSRDAIQNLCNVFAFVSRRGVVEKFSLRCIWQVLGLGSCCC